MGNHKFRLSDMIPNAWFYKLKYMNTSRKTKNQKKKHPPLQTTTSAATTTTTRSSSFSSTSSSSIPFALQRQPTKPHHNNHHLYEPQHRKSYYFSRDLNPPDPFHNNLAPEPTHPPDPPRTSSKKKRNTKNRIIQRNSAPKLVTSSVSTGCSCRAKPDSYPSCNSFENESRKAEFGSDNGSFHNMASSLPCQCSLQNHIVSPDEKFENLHLPPIITKNYNRGETIEEKTSHGSLSVKIVKEDIDGIPTKEQRSSPVRRFPLNSPGVKLRITNSPRLRSHHRRPVQVTGRKSVSRRSLSESFAVVMLSEDPQLDFKESMVEMIMENNIRASKDLEELLACYLSLNSDEYHELIIEVFKQIWFDVTDIRWE